MLHQNAPVLNHLNASLRELFGDHVVPNAELEPNRPWLFGEDIGDVLFHVGRPSKHIDEVDRSLDRGERTNHRLTQNRRHLRVVNWDGNDLEAGILKILRHRE